MRPGGPAPAQRTVRPLPRTGPRGRARGVPARPTAPLLDNVGPPRGRCVPPSRPGSICGCPSRGFCTWRTTAPHAPSRARPVCHWPPPVGGCAAGYEREASRRRELGPPGIREQGGGGGSLEGAWEVVHRKMVAQRRPHAGGRAQAPDPRVPALHRQAHKLQHHLAPKAPRTRGPPRGGVRGSAPPAPRPAECPPLGGAPPGLLPCAGLGLAP